ncbi:MAG: PAS domain S-box protein [Candidatus Thorarchaeota archaeon]|nr:PAS domain S-box protein [Candidatus Thorarchaeota archaeon]
MTPQTKKPSTAFRSARARDRAVYDKISLAVVEFDAELNLLYANAAAQNLLSLRKSDIDTGLHVANLIVPEQVNLVQEAFRRLRNGAEPTSLSLRALRGNAIQVPIEVFADMIHHRGKLKGYVVYATDMTRRAQIEDKLIEKSAFFKTSVENSLAGIFQVGHDFRFEYMNDRLCDMVGRTRSELLGHDFREFLHPDSVDLVADRYVKRQRGENVPSIYEFKIIRKDGASRDVEITSTTMMGRDGKMNTIAQLLDITEEVESKRALEESERRYRDLVETMDDGLAMDDENGVITYINDALCKMLGYAREEIVGLSGYEIFHSISKNGYGRRSIARAEGITEHYEAELLTKNGATVPVMVSACPLPTENGDYKGSFALFTDISELKSVEAEARFLLDLILHDIGNQLQLVLAGADLAHKESSPEVIETAQQYILDGAHRCIDLIHKVRSAEESKVEPLRPMDLIEVLIGEAHLLARQYGVTPKFRILPETLMVNADSSLSQLVWNIMENSAKHNRNPKKRIWVNGRRVKGNKFKLVIADDGPGLSDSKKIQVFNSERRFGGVGLHLVRRLVKKYGAVLEVKDRVRGKPGKGLKIVMTFDILE